MPQLASLPIFMGMNPSNKPVPLKVDAAGSLLTVTGTTGTEEALSADTPAETPLETPPVEPETAAAPASGTTETPPATDTTTPPAA
jgi:hypothetical protein